MKKDRKEELLEHMRLIPNISLACEKAGIARNTFYTWCNQDAVFKERVKRSLRLGNESVNDLAESNVIKLIKAGDLQACRYWLDNHKLNYVKPRVHGFLSEITNQSAKEDSIAAKILKGAGIMPYKDKAKTEEEEALFNIDDPDVLV